MKLSKAIDWLCIGVVIAFFISAIFRPYDSTDDSSAGIRSGLSLYTDHATGCQYIKASWFAELTPRMGYIGGKGYTHICATFRDHLEDWR